jgi:hypothetical protein
LDIISIIDKLLLFNEKADELENSSFIRDYVKIAIVTTYKRSQNVIQSQRYDGPTDESIKAFVLTIRFFLQTKESISLDNITKLYARLPIDAELVNSVNELNTKINTFLDTISDFKIVHNNTTNSNTSTYTCVYTYRNLLDIFLYGGLAHADKEKKIIYDDLKNRPYFFTHAEAEFLHALKTYLDTIFLIRDINNKVLKQLSTST